MYPAICPPYKKPRWEIPDICGCRLKRVFLNLNFFLSWDTHFKIETISRTVQCNIRNTRKCSLNKKIREICYYFFKLQNLPLRSLIFYICDYKLMQIVIINNLFVLKCSIFERKMSGKFVLLKSHQIIYDFITCFPLFFILYWACHSVLYVHPCAMPSITIFPC